MVPENSLVWVRRQMPTSTASSGVKYLYDCTNSTSTVRGLRIILNLSGGEMGIDTFTPGGNLSFSASLTHPLFTVNNGAVHKIRLAVDRDVFAKVYIDGIEISDPGALLDGEDTQAPNVTIGARFDGAAPADSTIYGLRVTIGNFVNNAGGPRGG